MSFKKITAISVLAISFLFIVGLGIIYASSAPPESPHYSYSECTSCHSDVVDYHNSAASHENTDCIGCHGDRTDEQSMYDAAHGQYYDGPHKVHLTSDQLLLDCTQCHESVDIREGSASSVRRQVSMLCSECHSPFSSKMDPAWASQDCTACHADWQDQHSSKPYINNAGIGADDCIGCHGGRSWYLSGAASNSLHRGNIYWFTYSDYTAGHLSVDFTIANAGPGTSYGLNVSNIESTNGVSTVTAFPLALGDVSQDGTAGFTVVYQVPSGVGSFMTTIYANAVNDDDETQYWPSPPPSP